MAYDRTSAKEKTMGCSKALIPLWCSRQCHDEVNILSLFDICKLTDICVFWAKWLKMLTHSINLSKK